MNFTHSIFKRGFISHYVTVKRIDFGNPLYATRALAKPRRVPLGLVTILKNSLFEQCHPRKINDLLCDDQISIINNPEVGLVVTAAHDPERSPAIRHQSNHFAFS